MQVELTDGPATVDAADAALTMVGVSKHFGGVRALSSVDLTAHAGEVQALLGANGAGKSTLIRTLTGVLAPDTGTAQLDGEALPLRGEPRAAEAAGIAAVYQELTVVGDLTVAENIWVADPPRTRWGTIDRRAVRAATEELFDRWDIPAIAHDALVRTLSLEQRQVVEVAKALARPFRVLVLDEPTSALGRDSSAWLLATARRLAHDEGRIVLFVTHRLREVREVADRVTVLRNGELVATERADALTDDDIVERTMGRKVTSLYPVRIPPPTTAPVVLQATGLRNDDLRGVDLSARQGEVLGVGGLQGQGQLPLFLALCGGRRARGTVTVDGISRRSRSPRQSMRHGRGVVMIPDDRGRNGLLLTHSILDNLMLVAGSQLSRLGFRALRAERREVEEARQRLGIVMRGPDQPVAELSGGNQQKVLLARALRSPARIVLLYDPTRGVDVGTKAEIYELVRDLGAQGYTVLFFSTEEPELVNVCDRVLVMSRGAVAGEVAGDDLSEEALARLALTGGEAATADGLAAATPEAGAP